MNTRAIVDLLSSAVMRYFPEGTRASHVHPAVLCCGCGCRRMLDSLELYRRARQAGITLAPGYVFSPTQQFPNFIRLNAAEFNYSTERAAGTAGRHDQGTGRVRDGPSKRETQRPLACFPRLSHPRGGCSMLVRWLVFIHVLAAIAFFLFHGVSVAMAFKVRKETDFARIRATAGSICINRAAHGHRVRGHGFDRV